MNLRKATIGIPAFIVIILSILGVVYIINLSNDSVWPSDRSDSGDSTSEDRDRDSKDSDSESETEKSSITSSEAEDIAIEAYGGTVKETESDHHQGREAWEVEIRDSKHGRIEVKVDKHTGEILEMERD